MADEQNAAVVAEKTEVKEKKAPNSYDFEPPLATVRKVVKSALPDGVKMGSDTVQACAKAAGIFVHYLTSCANDFCKENKRNTLSADDVLEALKELEFEELIEPLKAFLDQQKAVRAEKAASKKAAAAAAETSSGNAAAEGKAEPVAAAADNATPKATGEESAKEEAAAAAAANSESTLQKEGAAGPMEEAKSEAVEALRPSEQVKASEEGAAPSADVSATDDAATKVDGGETAAAPAASAASAEETNGGEAPDEAEAMDVANEGDTEPMDEVQAEGNAPEGSSGGGNGDQEAT